jgi:hypothetical protein
MEWFRHRHGLSTDSKLAYIARCCDVHRAFVVLLWSYILERASGCDDRGSLVAFNKKESAFALDMQFETVELIVAEMEAHGLIHNNRVFNWNRHQFQSDSSADRVKRYRERQRNVSVTLQERSVTHQNRTDQSRSEQNPAVSPREIVKSDPPGFAAFYAAYPRKIGRGAAERAYAAALKAKRVDPAAILTGLEAAKRRWAADKTEPQYIPHPATWLNGERWADEAPAKPVKRPFGHGDL